jgi:hypothetical protein
MVKKYVIFLKRIWRSWFIILVIIIIILAFYNLIAAIILTTITLLLFLLSYVPSFFFKNRVLRFLKKYYRIKDDDVIKHFSNKKEKVKKVLFDLAQNQAKKDWLIVFVNNHYIYFHKDIIEKYKTLYQKGYGEKKIFDLLQKIDIETRAEIKAIKTTLEAHNRLPEEPEK